jgi:hypothetical protein
VKKKEKHSSIQADMVKAVREYLDSRKVKLTSRDINRGKRRNTAVMARGLAIVLKVVERSGDDRRH